MKEPIEVWILAGGLSSRMGRDKAGITLHGKRLLARVKAEAARTNWPVRTLRTDIVQRCGPLGGVYTALKKSQAAAVVFVACDMPWVSAELLQRVAKGLTGNQSAVFTKHDEYAGFPFALSKSTLQQVEAQIQSRDFSLQTLAANTRAKLVRAKRAEILDIDTPEDLHQARLVRG